MVQILILHGVALLLLHVLSGVAGKPIYYFWHLRSVGANGATAFAAELVLRESSPCHW